MNKSKIGLMAALFVALVLAGNAVPAVAQSTVIGFVNGTGAEVTGLIISPSKEQYPTNKNAYAPQNLQVNDGADFNISLPEHWEGIESFDIAVASGKKMLISQRAVKLDIKNGLLPVLVLKDSGKISRARIVGFITGVGASAILLASHPAGTIIARLIMRLPPPLSWIIWAALPATVGAIGYMAGEKVGETLIPGSLDIQVYYK